MVDFSFLKLQISYNFVVDPDEFLNSGLLSSSFWVFCLQLFIPGDVMKRYDKRLSPKKCKDYDKSMQLQISLL